MHVFEIGEVSRKEGQLMNAPDNLGNYQRKITVYLLLMGKGGLPDKTVAVHGFQHGTASATDLRSPSPHFLFFIKPNYFSSF